MYRKLICAVAVLVASSVSSLTPVEARQPVTPQQFCLDAYDTRTDDDGTLSAYWVPMKYPQFGGMVMDLPILSREGCISTVARGLQTLRAEGYVMASHLSMPAALSQCEYLESLGITYPYDFYGAYTAHNRAQCAHILIGLHTGALAPPPEHPENPPVE